MAELNALGGLHTLDDFAAQSSGASYVTPISVAYRGVELWELPPSNQGIVALMMLKMLDRLGKPAGRPGLGGALPRAAGGGSPRLRHARRLRRRPGHGRRAGDHMLATP